MLPRLLRAPLLLGVAVLVPQKPDTQPAAAPRFEFPCSEYTKGLRGSGNFGMHVDAKGSPFHGSYHLAEDVWLPAGTEVRAIADGVVRYSAFSPTWTDDKGSVHWNLGNVIVIEHALVPPIEDTPPPEAAALHAVCSFYVHLAADRRVQTGERVTRGQPIGRIGADKSEENGRYPAHLHFGIHKGPYVQVPPALERELRQAAASKTGLVLGPFTLRGELVLERQGESDLLIRAAEGGPTAVLSLLVGSTAPKDPPPDIMGWCEGYGPRATLSEWLAPAKFLRRQGAR